MRRLPLIFLALLITQLIHGQQLTVRYRSNASIGTITPMPSSSITSDFGRRHSTWGTSRWSPSPWHRGIDYAPTNCNGLAIVTIAAGRVQSISSGYKVLTIEGGTWSGTPENPIFTENTNDFGYGHLFNDDDIGNGILSGNFVFLKMNRSEDYAILNLNVTPPATPFAIGESAGTVTYNNVTYTVKTRVDANQLIAPIGNSGNGDYPVNPRLFD